MVIEVCNFLSFFVITRALTFISFFSFSLCMISAIEWGLNSTNLVWFIEIFPFPWTRYVVLLHLKLLFWWLRSDHTHTLVPNTTWNLAGLLIFGLLWNQEKHWCKEKWTWKSVLRKWLLNDLHSKVIAIVSLMQHSSRSWPSVWCIKSQIALAQHQLSTSSSMVSKCFLEALAIVAV